MLCFTRQSVLIGLRRVALMASVALAVGESAAGEMTISTSTAFSHYVTDNHGNYIRQKYTIVVPNGRKATVTLKGRSEDCYHVTGGYAFFWLDSAKQPNFRRNSKWEEVLKAGTHKLELEANGSDWMISPSGSFYMDYMYTLNYDVTVTYAADVPTTLTLDKTAVTVSAAEGTKTLSVTCNKAWTATTSVGWISFTSGTSAGNGNGTILYHRTGNTSTGARTGTITVTADGKKVTCTVTQNGLTKADVPNLVFAGKSEWPAAVFLGDCVGATAAKKVFEEGELIFLYNRFGNSGGKGTGAGFSVRHRVLNASGSVVGETVSSVDAMPSGLARLWDGKAFSILQGLPPGNYTYQCVLDNANAIQEWSESDNTATVSFTVKKVYPLVSLKITGPDTFYSNEKKYLTCTATYGDGSTKTVTPTWTVSSGASYARITEAGKLKVGEVYRLTSITVSAYYSERSSMAAADYTVRISPWVDAATALGNPSLALANAGNTPWFGQAFVTESGGMAARSGAIGDSQSSSLKTSVTGPGRIAFDWRVSCEDSAYVLYGRDYLAFMVDSVAVAKIAGTDGGWSSFSYEIPEGTHALKWKYAKDVSLAKGDDAGYLDNLVWTQYPCVSLSAESIKIDESAGFAEVDVRRSGGSGSAAIYYQTMDGSADPSQPAATAGRDYVRTSGILHWKENDFSARTIRVKLVPDLVPTWSESKRFRIKIYNPYNPEKAGSVNECGDTYVIAPDVCTVKVKNVDERSVGAVAVVGEPLAVTAGGMLRVRVARAGGDDGRIAVTVKTQPGTALADVDYVHVSETLVWEDGEDGEKEFLVDTLDAKSAEAKTFNVKLTALAEWKGEALDVPATPVRKSYITLNGTAEPPPVIKTAFTVTGPGMFTAEPYIASGSGILKYKTTGGWTPIPSGKTFNLPVPAGETTVQFKIASASTDARLAFVKQIRGLDYRFVSLTNPAYLQVAADGSLVDSKGREILFEKTYELTQGVFESVSEDFFGVDNPMTLVGGSVPTGMFTYVGGDDWMSGLCLAPCIEGVPVKAKDYVAVFRFTAGEYKKRIAILTFKVKAADLDFGNYYGVLRTEDPVSGFARFGWLKYSVAADGTVSAKATVGGVKHKFSDRCFDVGEGSRVPEVLTYSWDNGSQVDLVVDGGMATVRLGYGSPTYSCELHRAEADLADFAGYYTLALVPTDCCWCEPPCGNGYLTLTVGADGSVVTAGKFPDGTDFTASSVAYRAGDALEIPVFAAVAPWSFGGVLRIRPDRTVELGKAYNASVFDSSAALDWYGSPFGYGGALRLVPAGGYYNTVFNLQTYYLNRDFSIDAEGAPETALELVGNAFGPNTTNTKLTFARATGIVSGKFDNWQTGTRVRYYGVVPMYRDWASPLSASAWATGFYLLPQPDGSVDSRPFAINAE